MSATNSTLLYIGAKPYPKPPMDSAPNDFRLSAKRKGAFLHPYMLKPTGHISMSKVP